MKKTISPDLSIELCKVRFQNPLVLASGILGTSAELMARVAKAGAGAVTTKSCSLEARKGHRNPTVISDGNFMLNAVGLSNPGVKEECVEIKKFKKLCPDTPIIASIFADSVENFGKVAHEISQAQPHFIEANISCPNVREEFGTSFSSSPSAAASVAREIKKATSIPLLVKLSPNVTDISQIAKAVDEAGADGITACNTFGPGLAIDAACGKPILHNKVGGVSGAAIKPLALRVVYEISPKIKIPIIGTGGISCGTDAAEMIMAGATAVGVGTAVHYRGPQALCKIAGELKEFMQKQKYVKLNDFQGMAHKPFLHHSKL